jgi:hypothetical protein
MGARKIPGAFCFVQAMHGTGQPLHTLDPPILFDGAIHTGAGIQNRSKFAFFLATEGGCPCVTI